MSSYQEFKTFYSSNIILFIVLLFVIIYLVINWENVYNGNYWSGEIVKPILITGILFLIGHMILTWDDNQNVSEEDLVIPKYKLGQNDNLAKNEIIAANLGNVTNTNLGIENPNSNPNPNPNPITQSLNNKYKIMNKFDIQNNLNPTNPTHMTNQNQQFAPTLEHFGKLGQNLSHTDNNKMSNQNIFISQKNSSKYGIKFI